jgi:diaminopimelate decarboxylase
MIETDIEELGKKLTKRFKAFYWKDLTLIFEPGKFLVSEAGSFSKSKRGKTNYFNRFCRNR